MDGIEVEEPTDNRNQGGSHSMLNR